MQWLDEVRQRGRHPRPEVIEASLVRLAERIDRDRPGVSITVAPPEDIVDDRRAAWPSAS